jgi:hypothetical protein
MRKEVSMKSDPLASPAEPSRSKPFWVGPLLIVSTLSAAYLLTLLPGVGYTGDTAKFQFVGKVLGTPHETGYPTYVVLNHLFVTLFPFGSIAYKANLLSAIASIAACLFLFRILWRLRVHWWVGCLTAVTFGLTPTLWSQSVVAEVYTLNIFFVSLVLYFLVKWHQTQSDGAFYAACAAYALSFGNHLTMITFLPTVLYMVWANRQGFVIDLRKVLWVCLIVLLGALQYLYILWRTHSPDTPYLEMKAADLPSLWYSLTGGHFRTRLFPFSLQPFLTERLPFFFRLLFREYHALLLVIPIGLLVLKDRRLIIALLLGWFCSTTFALNYGIPDVFIYFLPGYLVLAIYAGCGLNSLILQLRGRATYAGRAALILVPMAFWLLNFGRADQHANTAAAKNVVTVLNTVRRDALIIIPSYDYAEFFYYYLLAGGKQRDSIYVLYDIARMIPYSSVRSYLAEGRPLVLPLQRILAPKGLTVYFYNEEYEVGSPSTFYIGPTDPRPFGPEVQERIELRKSVITGVGLTLTPLAGNFYKVDASNSQTFSLSSPKDGSRRAQRQ